MTEVYLNAADPKLFEGIAELAAASDGNDWLSCRFFRKLPNTDQLP